MKSGAASARRLVVHHPVAGASQLREHELQTQLELARVVARLRGDEFAGRYEAGARYPLPLFFVPSDTLPTLAVAHALGVRDRDALFGGVVPAPFVRTKLISHGLVDPESAAPAGWSRELAAQLEPVVLPGYSVFDAAAARRAARRLFERYGAVRCKRPDGVGGLGQSVHDDFDSLAAAIDAVEPAEWASGWVLEADLRPARTLCVGQVCIGGAVASYVGHQRATRNNEGQAVYGGSTITVVRGGYGALAALDLDAGLRLAIAQAEAYDAAAHAAYPGMFVSRANVDIAQGSDGRGCERSGVLEQSWRIGGASAAELAAFARLQADPGATRVVASTVEVYGADPEVPPRASVHYRGADAHGGPLLKYTVIDDDGHA